MTLLLFFSAKDVIFLALIDLVVRGSTMSFSMVAVGIRSSSFY